MGPREKPELPSLSDAEWEVMNVVWSREAPWAARDVHAALEGRGWAVKTVKTLLSRLVAKGALEYEAVGNVYLYRAAVAREALLRRDVPDFIERVMGGSIGPVLLHFIEERGLTDEEAERLRALLERRGQKGRQSGRREKE